MNRDSERQAADRKTHRQPDLRQTSSLRARERERERAGERFALSRARSLYELKAVSCRVLSSLVVWEVSCWVVSLCANRLGNRKGARVFADENGGRSCVSCCSWLTAASLMTLLVAVIVGASLDHIAHTHFDPVTLDPKLAPLLAPSGLNRKQFAREGFVLVRGLLRGELLREAQEAGIQEAARSHLLFDRLFFAYNKITFNVWQRQLGLASVAFGSAAPRRRWPRCLA